MHSSRMRTARAMTGRILRGGCMPRMPPLRHPHLPSGHACPPSPHTPLCHAHPLHHTHPPSPCMPPFATHTPPFTTQPPLCHTCPPFATHATPPRHAHPLEQPCMPPPRAATHASPQSNHACLPGATTHAPPVDRMWTHTSENITLPQLRCGW